MDWLERFNSKLGESISFLLSLFIHSIDGLFPRRERERERVGMGSQILSVWVIMVKPLIFFSTFQICAF